MGSISWANLMALWGLLRQKNFWTHCFWSVCMMWNLLSGHCCFTWCLMGMVYFTQVACCSVSSSSSFFSRFFTFSLSSRSIDVIRCSLEQQSTVGYEVLLSLLLVCSTEVYSEWIEAISSVVTQILSPLESSVCASSVCSQHLFDCHTVHTINFVFPLPCVSKRIFPHWQHNHWFDGTLQYGQGQSKFPGLTAHLHCFVPVGPGIKKRQTLSNNR